MGCDCTKLGATTKIIPVKDATNQSASALGDNTVRRKSNASFDNIQKTPASNIIDDSVTNNEHVKIDSYIEQSNLVPVENLKAVSPDKSRKHEELTSVDDAANYVTSTSTNKSIQTSTGETTNEHLPNRIDSGTSNERLTSANSQQKKNDHRNETITDDTISVYDKSFVEKNSDNELNITVDQIEEKTNDSTHHPTISENLLSKRIGSGTSTKYLLTSRLNDNKSDITDDDIFSTSDTSVVEATINALPAAANEHVEIADADPEAFNSVFVKERQQAIDNPSYRSAIESWNPNSLQQLVENIKPLSKGKSLVDQHWIIFYWIAFNIEYDTVSYFAKDYKDQSAEGVFRTRKGVCAGYANIYKYLCDQLSIKCEKISGYAKGYGFDNRVEDAPLKTDHAWNAVQIEQHWYLMDATWGAGHLNKEKVFERKLNCVYYFARPHQMIYHHLPENDKWQLLQKPIKMTQYMQMPKIRSPYFDLNLELISPLHQAHLSLVRDKSYALVLIRTPADIDLLVKLKLHDEEIEGGHRIVFDAKNQLYRCYFAPASTGQHEVQIFAKRVNSNTQSYKSVVDFTLNINELPQNLVSYPKTCNEFYNLDLKLLSPINTHLMKVCNGATHVRVIIQAPDDVDLIGNLKNSEGQKIEGGHQVYFDQRKCLWKCKFAPDRDGLFTANIFGNKKSDAGSYPAVMSFKVEATQIVSPPLSYPKTTNEFHELNLKILSPANTHLTKVGNGATHASVIIRAPNDVDLIGNLKNSEGQKIEGGHQVYFDQRKCVWKCKFAPDRDGLFKANICGKKKSDTGRYLTVISLKIEATQIPLSPLSYPETTNEFYELNLKILSPANTHLIKVGNGATHARVIIQAPNDVELIGDLRNSDGKKIECGNQVYLDQRKCLWKCKFAPDRDGLFKAIIFGKKKSDTGRYLTLISLKIEATQIPLPPLSYPYTWQLFHDLNLKIEAPQNCSAVTWPENASYIEILMRTPDDVQLSCSIKYNKVGVKNGTLTQFDSDKRLWQLLFAPERIGQHELIIFAKHDNEEKSGCALKFHLNVTQLHQPMKFPTVYDNFKTVKGRIYEPLNGILKRDAPIPIHCVIPGAADVNLKLDSKWLKSEGYRDPILRRQITVGSKEVTIYARYGQNSDYNGLVKYTVQ